MAFNRGGPDIELTGIILGRFGKSILFQADYWDEPSFIPISQSEWLEEEGAEESGRGVMRIRGWLAKKNGWSET